MSLVNINTHILSKTVAASEYTIKVLALSVGTSRSTISRLIHHKQDRVQKEVAEALSKSLNVPYNSLLKDYSNVDMRRMFGDDDLPF